MNKRLTGKWVFLFPYFWLLRELCQKNSFVCLQTYLSFYWRKSCFTSWVPVGLAKSLKVKPGGRSGDDECCYSSWSRLSSNRRFARFRERVLAIQSVGKGAAAIAGDQSGSFDLPAIGLYVCFFGPDDVLFSREKEEDKGNNDKSLFMRKHIFITYLLIKFRNWTRF